MRTILLICGAGSAAALLLTFGLLAAAGGSGAGRPGGGGPQQHQQLRLVLRQCSFQVWGQDADRRLDVQRFPLAHQQHPQLLQLG
jgi:hypothetical protein